MAQFTMNIPSDKVQSFLTMMAQTGFNKTINNIKNTERALVAIPLNNNSLHQHPYYDWDFYNNDLLID